MTRLRLAFALAFLAAFAGNRRPQGSLHLPLCPLFVARLSPTSVAHVSASLRRIPDGQISLSGSDLGSAMLVYLTRGSNSTVAPEKLSSP